MTSKRIFRTGLVAAGVVTATLFATTAAYAAGQGATEDRNPGMQRMGEMRMGEMMGANPGMQRMHELHMSGNPGMQRMHELHMSGNPGMQRMHERLTGSMGA